MEIIRWIPALWLLVTNIAGFILCGVDKKRARNKQWRIPERNIFIAALLGGSVGVFLSLLLFRHKTRHLKFMLGIPLIFAAELAAVLLLRLQVFQ